MKEKTMKFLFAWSRNQCAFHGCNEQIVVLENDQESIIGEICHIEAQKPGGARFNPRLSHEEIDDKKNLILLCRNHHKLVDDNPSKYTVEVLRQMNEDHQDKTITEFEPWHARGAHLLYSAYIELHGDVHIKDSQVTIETPSVKLPKSKTKVVKKPYPESIGSDRYKREYIKYLIDKYNKFASVDEARKTNFHYGAIYTNVTKKFGAKWDNISIDLFEPLCSYLKGRIDRTRIARIRKSQGDLYHSFSEHERIMKEGR